MKKTIAKIMAAAMVVSTISAPNVLAATDPVFVNDLSIGSTKIIEDGVVKNSYTGKTKDNAYTINGTALYDAMVADYATNGNNDDFSWTVKDGTGSTLSLTGTASATDDGEVVKKTETGATPGEAATKTAKISSDQIAASTTLGDENYYLITNKVTTGNEGAFKATVVDGIPYRATIADGNLAFEIANTDATRAAILAAVESANVLDVTFIANTSVSANMEVPFFMQLADSTILTDSIYWNAFVKLKASNNRYIPIRVHVDAIDGTLNNLNGLYAEVVNGSVIAWRDKNGTRRALSSVDYISANWSTNKLKISDVETDDLNLLKSDIAKGKNLMLDEAYIFNVYNGTVYNYSTSNAALALYDWADYSLTDVETYSVGKIQDIRSGLFKKCKEKLVHAENVKWIRNGAFRENKQLKKAILSDSVSMKKINEKAFYKCKKLNTVKVKVNTLKQVGKNAFGDSTDKKSLKFNLSAGSKAKYNKAVKLFKKSGVKKAKFRKI